MLRFIDILEISNYFCHDFDRAFLESLFTPNLNLGFTGCVSLHIVVP